VTEREKKERMMERSSAITDNGNITNGKHREERSLDEHRR
jgi:hypothetical protein